MGVYFLHAEVKTNTVIEMDPLLNLPLGICAIYFDLKATNLVCVPCT